MRNEIEMHIIQEYQQIEKCKLREIQEAMDQDQEKSYAKGSEIRFTYINFIPLINKIKIDLFTGRKPSALYSTDYLSNIEELPEDFDMIDDLFLSNLFSVHESN